MGKCDLLGRFLCGLVLSINALIAAANDWPLDPALPSEASIPAAGTLIKFGDDSEYYLVYRYQKLQLDPSILTDRCGMKIPNRPAATVSFARDLIPDGPAINSEDALNKLLRDAGGQPPRDACDAFAFFRNQLRLARILSNQFPNSEKLSRLIDRDAKAIKELLPQCPAQTMLNQGETPFDLIQGGIPASALYNAAYQGGLIADIKTDGSGIVAAPQDLPNPAYWFNMNLSSNDIYTFASAIGIGGGKANTQKIVDVLGTPVNPSYGLGINYAAYAAGQQSYSGFTDWYLPSLNELQAVLQNVFTQSMCLAAQNNTSAPVGEYWSSSEVDPYYAYTVNCNDYSPGPPPTCSAFSGNSNPPCDFTKAGSANVRLVRAFGGALPVITDVTPGDQQATVYFSTRGNIGTTQQYTVTVSPGNITATGTASPITVGGLTNGTRYTLTVTATNADGATAVSGTSNLFIPGLIADQTKLLAFTSTGSCLNGYLTAPDTGEYRQISGTRVGEAHEGKDNVMDFATDSSNSFLYASSINGDASSTKGEIFAFRFAIDSSNKFIYASSTEGEIFAFRIDPSNLTLSRVEGSPFPGGKGTAPHLAIAKLANGDVLYMADMVSHTLYSYKVDKENGMLYPLAQITKESWLPKKLAVSQDNSHLYVLSNTDELFGYSIKPEDGSLTPVAGSPYTVEWGWDVAVAANKFVYVPDILANKVWGFSINQGGWLGPITGSPFALGGRYISESIAIHPSGKFAYMPRGENGQAVRAFSIDQTTGDLTSIDLGSAVGAENAFLVYPDPSGNNLFLLDNDGSIHSYKVNTDDGKLTPNPNTPLPRTNNDGPLLLLEIGAKK